MQIKNSLFSLIISKLKFYGSTVCMKVNNLVVPYLKIICSFRFFICFFTLYLLHSFFFQYISLLQLSYFFHEFGINHSDFLVFVFLSILSHHIMRFTVSKCLRKQILAKITLTKLSKFLPKTELFNQNSFFIDSFFSKSKVQPDFDE